MTAARFRRTTPQALRCKSWFKRPRPAAPPAPRTPTSPSNTACSSPHAEDIEQRGGGSSVVRDRDDRRLRLLVVKDGSHALARQLRIARRNENEVVIGGGLRCARRLPPIRAVIYLVGQHPLGFVTQPVKIDFRLVPPGAAHARIAQAPRKRILLNRLIKIARDDVVCVVAEGSYVEGQRVVADHHSGKEQTDAFQKGRRKSRRDLPRGQQAADRKQRNQEQGVPAEGIVDPRRKVQKHRQHHAANGRSAKDSASCALTLLGIGWFAPR